jgi:predicted ester cyclase
MSKELENKAIAVRWLDGFWGHSWTPKIVDDLAAADILLQFSLQMPRRGREDAKKFLIGIHEAFRDLEFHSATDLAADGDHLVCRLEGGGTHTGPAFLDYLIGFLPANSGRKMHLTGTTVLRIENGKIAEEMTRMTWAIERPRFRRIAA